MDCKNHEGHCNCENHIGCIQIVPIFNSLTKEEMIEVAAITVAKTLQKKEMIYMAGDEEHNLYVLHTGIVKIYRINSEGKEQVIRVVGPGDFIGELSLFSSLPMTDNAEALELSTMCVIEGAKLKELMKKYPSIALKAIEELSKRLESAEILIESINLNTVEQRLARALLHLSEGKKEVALNMTKGDFASQIGMSQETLSRKLTAFQDQGLIRLKGQRTIRLLDLEGLENIL